MAETLGTLCDKLTVVKLKQWHARNKIHISSLRKQEKQLQKEMEEFLQAATAGKIPLSRLTFDSNKVYRKKGNAVNNVFGNIGEVFSELCQVNCSLWHEQEKVYAFEKVPAIDVGQSGNATQVPHASNAWQSNHQGAVPARCRSDS